VIIGSGRKSREITEDDALMSRLRLDPNRQFIASQCSGALVLIHLGLVRAMPICTDRKTQAWVEAAGYEVLDRPFHARGRVATAGGCLASHYLAAWLIWNGAGRQAAVDALSYVLPHNEEAGYTRRALKHRSLHSSSASVFDAAFLLCFQERIAASRKASDSKERAPESGVAKTCRFPASARTTITLAKVNDPN